MNSTTLKRIDGWLQRTFGVLAAALLFLLMILTCLDVVGRYGLGAPVPGAFELSEVLLALTIYAALPLVTLHNEHVSIDLMDGFVPSSWVSVQQAGIRLFVTALLLLVAYCLFLKSKAIMAAGMRTDTLFIPLGVVSYLMTVAVCLSAVISAACIFERHHKREVSDLVEEGSV